MDNSYKPLKNVLLIREEKNNEYLLLNSTGKIIKINTIAKTILELCTGNNTIEDIVNIICSDYNVSYNVAYNDVQNYLEKLKICTLI